MMKNPMTIYALTLAMLAGTWWMLKDSLDTKPYPLARPLAAIPAQYLGAASRDIPIPQEDLNVLVPSSYLQRAYETTPPMQLLAVHFETQQAGKSMHSPKNCLPLAGFETVESRIVEIDSPLGRQPVNLYRVRHGSDAVLMLYWYQSPERVVASEIQAKGYLLLDRLSLHRSPGSIVRITVADGPGAFEPASKMAAWAMAQVKDSFGS